MKKYIMALDEGTTSCRCILYNKKGEMVSVAQKEFRQIYPNAGWVEHDAMEIWSTQIGVAQEALYKINCTYENIEAIGITNQRETTVVWDRETGEPVYNAIVWQCRRTAEYCDSLKAKGLEPSFREKTGQCRGRKSKGRGGKAAVWNNRNVAHMEAYRRQSARYRLFQRLKNHDVQHK